MTIEVQCTGWQPLVTIAVSVGYLSLRPALLHDHLALVTNKATFKNRAEKSALRLKFSRPGRRN